MYNEYAAYQSHFEINLRSEECTREVCGGWRLSDLDVWCKCSCWSGQTHPEVAMFEADIQDEMDRETFEATELPARLEAPRPWKAAPVSEYDDIPF